MSSMTQLLERETMGMRSNYASEWVRAPYIAAKTPSNHRFNWCRQQQMESVGVDLVRNSWLDSQT